MYIWVFPKIVVPQDGWFIRENHIKIDDLGVPLFSETPIYCSGRCANKVCSKYLLYLGKIAKLFFCEGGSKNKSQMLELKRLLSWAVVFVHAFYGHFMGILWASLEALLVANHQNLSWKRVLPWRFKPQLPTTSPTSLHWMGKKGRNDLKGQLGVPLTYVYPWYLLCSLGFLEITYP